MFLCASFSTINLQHYFLVSKHVGHHSANKCYALEFTGFWRPWVILFHASTFIFGVLWWTYVSSLVTMYSSLGQEVSSYCYRNDKAYVILWLIVLGKGSWDPLCSYLMKFQLNSHFGHHSTWQNQVICKFVQLFICSQYHTSIMHFVCCHTCCCGSATPHLVTGCHLLLKFCTLFCHTLLTHHTSTKCRWITTAGTCFEFIYHITTWISSVWSSTLVDPTSSTNWCWLEEMNSAAIWHGIANW